MKRAGTNRRYWVPRYVVANASRTAAAAEATASRPGSGSDEMGKWVPNEPAALPPMLAPVAEHAKVQVIEPRQAGKY